MYLPRFGDSILHTLQFAIAWQMLFFMPFQRTFLGSCYMISDPPGDPKIHVSQWMTFLYSP